MRRSDCLAVLVAVLFLGGAAAERLSLPRPDDAEAYHAAIRAASDAMPKRIGQWVAEELPVPPEAVAQLRPNIILNRSYTHLDTGLRATFLLVQCGDVRDLVAHYPPVCYPGRGLQLAASDQTVRTVGERRIPTTRYEFASTAFKQSDSVIVDNFMLLPDGRMKPDMGEMEREVGLSDRYFGAAQVQVVFSPTLPAQARDQAFTEIVGGYEPLIEAISKGVVR